MTLMAENKDDKEAPDSLGRRLLKTRTILVSEVVSDKLARAVTAQLLLMQEDDAAKPITVYVNSPGGSADSGFAIFDILRFVKPPIRTVVTGLSASAAILIGLAAKREHRYGLPNSRFLLHQPSTSVFGSATDISINAEEILKLRQRYNEIVAEETGRKVDKVTQDADRDFWLDAGGALDYGLVGKIIKGIDEVK